MARETRSKSKPAAPAKVETPVVKKKIQKKQEAPKQPVAAAPQQAPAAPAQAAAAAPAQKAAPQPQANAKGLQRTKTMLETRAEAQEYLDRMEKLDDQQKAEAEEEQKESAEAAELGGRKKSAAVADAPADGKASADKSSKGADAAEKSKGRGKQDLSKSRSPTKQEPKKKAGASAAAAPQKGVEKQKDTQQSPQKVDLAPPAAGGAAAEGKKSAVQQATPATAQKVDGEQKKEEQKQVPAKGLKRTDSRIGLPGGPVAGIVDIVFCCDTTGSMGSYLEQSQEATKVIATRIEEKCQGEDIDVKFGFVAYRDHPPQDSTYVTKVQDLVSRQEVLKFIQTLSASGGGDGPQAVMDGLWESVQTIKWRDASRIPSLRYVFHICDAPPHGDLYSSGSSTWQDGCPCQITIDQIIHVANIQEIRYKLIKCTSYGGLEQMAQIFKEQFTYYQETELSNAQELDIKMSDIIIRELCPDMDYNLDV